MAGVGRETGTSRKKVSTMSNDRGRQSRTAAMFAVLAVLLFTGGLFFFYGRLLSARY